MHLENPYTRFEQYRCFACHPEHPFGLRMVFSLEHDKVISEWMPHADYQGFYKVIHGGIQATLADEIAGWVVQVICKTAGVTRDLNVRYLKPVLLDNGPLKLEAWLDHQQGRTALVKVSILDRHQTLCTTADVVYHLFDEQTAREKFFYPGIEAFLPSR
ncbi:MAG TPA: PaaI family thioesterase [Bacteroidales bacterium]|nr:PaaI family thioesterase [Bacteroidales bacterium]